MEIIGWQEAWWKMKNELYKVLLQSDLTEEEINACEYRLRTFGSPYTEVEEQKIQLGQPVFVNPYGHYYKMLEPLLEIKDFLDAPEGALLFHEAVKTAFQIERYQGLDKAAIQKELLRKKLLEGCYGEHIARFLKELNVLQQNATLDYLLMLLQNKEEIYSFIYEIQLIFPNSMIFREHREKEKLYVCLGTEKREYALGQYEAIKDMFLPENITVYITWDRPFVLTDLNEMEAWGNCMI